MVQTAGESIQGRYHYLSAFALVLSVTCGAMQVHRHTMVLELRLSPELSGQLRRAAVSIINNTQEGAARRTAPDLRRFYDMAFS